MAIERQESPIASDKVSSSRSNSSSAASGNGSSHKKWAALLNSRSDHSRSNSSNSCDDNSSSHSSNCVIKSCLKDSNKKKAFPMFRKRQSAKSVTFDSDDELSLTIPLDEYTDEEYRACFVSGEELERSLQKCGYIAEEERNRPAGEKGFLIRGLEKLMFPDHTYECRQAAYAAILRNGVYDPEDTDVELYKEISHGSVCEALWLAEKDAEYAQRYYADNAVGITEQQETRQQPKRAPRPGRSPTRQRSAPEVNQPPKPNLRRNQSEPSQDASLKQEPLSCPRTPQRQRGTVPPSPGNPKLQVCSVTPQGNRRSGPPQRQRSMPTSPGQPKPLVCPVTPQGNRRSGPPQRQNSLPASPRQPKPQACPLTPQGKRRSGPPQRQQSMPTSPGQPKSQAPPVTPQQERRKAPVERQRSMPASPGQSIMPQACPITPQTQRRVGPVERQRSMPTSPGHPNRKTPISSHKSAESNSEDSKPSSNRPSRSGRQPGMKVPPPPTESEKPSSEHSRSASTRSNRSHMLKPPASPAPPGLRRTPVPARRQRTRAENKQT